MPRSQTSKDAEYAFLETDYDADTLEGRSSGRTRNCPPMTAPTGPGPTISTAPTGSQAGRRSSVIDWYCAEYEDGTLYELHNGQYATGTEELDDAVIKSVDPAIVRRAARV